MRIGQPQKLLNTASDDRSSRKADRPGEISKSPGTSALQQVHLIFDRQDPLHCAKTHRIPSLWIDDEMIRKPRLIARRGA